MRLRAFAFALLVLAGCGEPRPATQVMLVIDAEPGVRTESSTLFVQVFGGQEAEDPLSYASRYVRTHEGVSWPFRVALAPLEPEPPRGWLATVTALNDEELPVVSTAARGGYDVERTVRVDVLLEDACAGVFCERMRCEEGACVDPLVSVPAAPSYDGGAP